MVVIHQFCDWCLDVSDNCFLSFFIFLSDKNANVFLRYSTLDNVDGKQARRTGTSSGLGELFEFVPSPDQPRESNANEP